MGFSSKEDYQTAAQAVFRRQQGVDRFVRPNGDQLFYDYRTNDFVILGADGKLTTYLRPDHGQDYWLRQTAE
jgi:pyocin large subunit-like protein